MLLRIRDQEVHELDVCTCSCRGSTPGLPGLVTVVHRVDGQVDRPCARSDDLGDARLPDSRETGEHYQASAR